MTGTVKLVRAQDFVDSKPQMNGRFPNGTCGGTLNSTCDDPNDVYPILVVEGSPELKARASGSGNKMTSVTANEVDLGFNRADRSSSKWTQYDGKRVRVTVNSDDSKIPSDPTMPTVRVRLGVVSVDVL